MSLESLVNSISRGGVAPLLSMLKAAVRSRRPSPRSARPPEDATPLVVMGNGPSLRSFLDFLKDNPGLREQCALEAVNFAAITPEFFSLRPELYVLADPHFFDPDSTDEKVHRLWDAFARCDWPMTLWLPLQHRRAAEAMLKVGTGLRPVDKVGTGLRPVDSASPITVKWMNLTPVEGQGFLADRLIHAGLGMPRPRNVLIPAIVCAMREGYRDIFLVGADHSWSRSLWVDDQNHVVSVQPHFYKDDAKEKARVEAEYAGYHLHDILQSLTVAFRSYFDILRYASRHGYRIVNATPESFIDAFPRCSYAQIRPQSEP